MPQPRQTAPVTIVYAHRGAAIELPENTMPAFERALELGADALEMDGHLTRDGVIVVAHDPDGERLCGVSRRIQDTDFNELRTWNVATKGNGDLREARIPSFEEVLRRFRDTPINIDLKQTHPSMVQDTVALVRRYRAQEQVTLASFSMKTLLHVRALGYEGRTNLASLDLVGALFAPTWIVRNMPLRGDVAQIPTRHGKVKLATKRHIDRLHSLGIDVHFWTINDPQEAQALAQLGADAVMTDDPRKIVPALRALQS
jgi:glycerophosphoryl diester phosphodiesterase